MTINVPRHFDAHQRLEYRSIQLENGCVVWTGAIDKFGYGRIKYNGKVVFAHRLAWELINGPVPEGMQLDHLCNREACINVDHLELVTPAENSRRAVKSHGCHIEL